MGEVYRARDTRLGREVAVKVLPEELLRSPEARARFEREAKTASRLSHPHICVLHDFGREDGTDYLVMELVEGETLARRLTRGPVPPREVSILGAQIADALDRAHRARVVHRDLKPGNIMLTKSGAKLMDFGLARSVGRAAHPSVGGATQTALRDSLRSEDPITAQGTIVGTVQYMAPEQIEGKEADARSDLWALGCVLYEMATGKRAFEGTSTASVISAILRDQPSVMAELAPLAPPALERAVTQCLAKDPDDRWQTAGDLGRELAWIAEGGSRAGMPVPLPVARPWRERAGWVLAGIVTMAAVALSVLWWRARENVDRQFTFTPLAHRPMNIGRPRFAPDGKTIVFNAGGIRWHERQIFVIRPEFPEPQPISEPGVVLRSVSSRGELAVHVHEPGEQPGDDRTFLARMPLGGGAPRKIVEGTWEEDWSPDGSRLAIIREVEGRVRLEFTIGNVLCESTGALSDPRFSPQGDLIAFVDHPYRGDARGSVCVVDLRGRKRVLVSDFVHVEGLAWSQDGKEILFSGIEETSSLVVYAVTLTGRRRIVLQSAGNLAICDVSREGRWLATRLDRRDAVMVHRPGWGEDRDLSWLDGSGNGVFSHDGNVLVFTDWSDAAGPNATVCLRKTDGSPIVRLGEGSAGGISRDGKWVLAGIATPSQLVAYPTGAGETHRFERGPIETYGGGSWFPSGDSILFTAREAGGISRFYVQAFAGGPPRAVTPEGVGDGVPSRDVSSILASGPDGLYRVYAIGGGEPRPVKGLTPRDQVIRWNADGRSVIVGGGFPSVGPVERVDLVTGLRRPFLELRPPNREGLMSCNLTSLSDDDRTYTYSIALRSSTLFLVDRMRGKR